MTLVVKWLVTTSGFKVEMAICSEDEQHYKKSQPRRHNL